MSAKKRKPQRAKKSGAQSRSKGATKKRATKQAAARKPAAAKKRAAAGASATRAKKAAPKGKAPSKKRAAAKKPAVKKAAATKPAAKAKRAAKAPAIAKRRDGAGHLDPTYAADLREKSIESAPPKDDDRAFLEGPQSGDDLAEELGKQVVESATSGEDDVQQTLTADVTEEVGGPFIETSGGTEFASGTDASNPADADREPFPTT